MFLILRRKEGYGKTNVAIMTKTARLWTVSDEGPLEISIDHCWRASFSCLMSMEY